MPRSAPIRNSPPARPASPTASQTDGHVAKAFAAIDVAPLMQKLEAADIAFARVNDTALLSKHPHLRRITVDAPSGPVSTPAPAPIWAGVERRYGADPGARRAQRKNSRGIS